MKEFKFYNETIFQDSDEIIKIVKENVNFVFVLNSSNKDAKYETCQWILRKTFCNCNEKVKVMNSASLNYFLIKLYRNTAGSLFGTTCTCRLDYRKKYYFVLQ